MKRTILWSIPILVITILTAFMTLMWSASNQLLHPSWKGLTKNLSECTPEALYDWGDACGNLRMTRAFHFNEVMIPSANGYELPGWLIRAEANGGTSKGAIFLIHGGGSDRREHTKHISFFLSQGLDVLTFDLSCHGEAPCPVPGMTYGHREYRDVLSAYLFLTDQYERVYAMGSSVGAASLLIALPSMPKLKGVIAENPMASFQQLIKEAPEAKSLPGWATDLLLDLAMIRGRFDGLLSAAHSLSLIKNIPIYFIHSKADKVVSYRQTQQLLDIYRGPKMVWFPEQGEHSAIQIKTKVEYERRLEEFLTKY